MSRTLAACTLMCLGVTVSAFAQQPDKIIDVRVARPPAGNTFEAIWAAYRKADRGGDAESAAKLLREIRRLRVERNIESLEVVAMALVVRGLDRLGTGELEQAQQHFENAASLDPHLPEAYFAQALLKTKKGPLSWLGAARDILDGLEARLPTARGRSYVRRLLVPVAFMTLFPAVAVFAACLVLRYGALLRHDIEETFGMGRSRALALGTYGVLLLLPLILFQGCAWLPFWWMTLLFVYLGWAEKTLTLLALVASLSVAPVVQLLDARLQAERNPLYRAGILAVEGGPDARAIQDLETASHSNPDDRDLLYLLAAQYKKAGRYEDAEATYKQILLVDERDGVALNNMANLEFIRGEFPAAIARYQMGIDTTASAEARATFYYNLSLAHLQRFEYQPAQEQRSHADRLARGLVQDYESVWKYAKEGAVVAMVVDLCLTEDEVLAKFAGKTEGIGIKNVAGKGLGGLDASGLARGGLNRFTGFAGIFLLVVLVRSRMRGGKMFTMRCLKCGTPFCRRCHLGAAVGGLCTQCHHLFIVRDGVSGPARNQKLLEVQNEDARRERIFRVLSLLSPGAGHLYASRTLEGAALLSLWYFTIVTTLVAGRLLPVSETPGSLTGPWGLAAAAILLLVVYVTANRARPDFDVAVPLRRTARRGQAA